MASPTMKRFALTPLAALLLVGGLYGVVTFAQSAVVTHKFVSSLADGGDTRQVQPQRDWNDAHNSGDSGARRRDDLYVGFDLRMTCREGLTMMPLIRPVLTRAPR